MKNKPTEYRGGYIEKHPSITGARKGNWRWDFGGVGGWVDSATKAKAKIDSILSEAAAVLCREATRYGSNFCRAGVEE